MTDSPSRKKSQGRPKLDPLEKQRRLVARLSQTCLDITHQLIEQSGTPDAADAEQQTMLNSTYTQRMNLARTIAEHEQTNSADSAVAAKEARKKLNLFRPLGFTEESWNALPDDSKRLAPGKPKMPVELELARLEIERDEEISRLRKLETDANEAPADLRVLQDQHGKTGAGRPGKDILGALDRQMHTAIYKRRDLIKKSENEPPESTGGRPRKAIEERLDHFTRIIEHCQRQIVESESKLPLLDLQRRLLKRLRDKATRLRLHIKTELGTELIKLKKELALVDERVKYESSILKDREANIEALSDSQIECRLSSTAEKIKTFDSLELTISYKFEDKHEQNSRIQSA